MNSGEQCISKKYYKAWTPFWITFLWACWRWCLLTAVQNSTLPAIVWEGSSTYIPVVTGHSKYGTCGTWPRAVSYCRPRAALEAFLVKNFLFCWLLEASRSRWTPQAGEVPVRRGQLRGKGLKGVSRGICSCCGQLHINGECLKAEVTSGFLGLLCLTSLMYGPRKWKRAAPCFLCRIGSPQHLDT